jgi:hypothetical protein
MLSVVWVRLVPLVFVCASTFGCGDGIGRPIVEDEPGAFGAAASGGMAGGSGAMGGASGAMAEAGSGGRGANPGFGGRFPDWDGIGGRGDSRPPPPCEGITEWSEESAEAEYRVFELLAFGREFGFACPTGTSSIGAPYLVMRHELQCAARRHSRDMNEREFFDHVNPDGENPEDRIRRTGYAFGLVGESIVRASGGPDMDPYQVLESIALAEGECDNLVDTRFDSVGIGRYGDLWTLDFAGP